MNISFYSTTEWNLKLPPCKSNSVKCWLIALCIYHRNRNSWYWARTDKNKLLEKQVNMNKHECTTLPSQSLCTPRHLICLYFSRYGRRLSRHFHLDLINITIFFSLPHWSNLFSISPSYIFQLIFFFLHTTWQRMPQGMIRSLKPLHSHSRYWVYLENSPPKNKSFKIRAKLKTTFTSSFAQAVHYLFPMADSETWMIHFELGFAFNSSP